MGPQGVSSRPPAIGPGQLGISPSQYNLDTPTLPLGDSKCRSLRGQASSSLQHLTTDRSVMQLRLLPVKYHMTAYRSVAMKRDLSIYGQCLISQRKMSWFGEEFVMTCHAQSSLEASQTNSTSSGLYKKLPPQYDLQACSESSKSGLYKTSNFG